MRTGACVAVGARVPTAFAAAFQNIFATRFPVFFLPGGGTHCDT